MKYLCKFGYLVSEKYAQKIHSPPSKIQPGDDEWTVRQNVNSCDAKWQVHVSLSYTLSFLKVRKISK